MAIRWSARQVVESLDELDKILDEAEPILQRLLDKASETAKLPNLPDYIGQPLRWFCQKTGDFYSGQKSRLDKIREYIPKQDLAKEQKRFEQYLDLYGDTEKAQEALKLFQ